MKEEAHYNGHVMEVCYVQFVARLGFKPLNYSLLADRADTNNYVSAGNRFVC